MARTSSTMLELGTHAPDFSLANTNPGVGGETVSLADFAGARALLVVFWCNHCPYVLHIQDRLVEFVRTRQQQGLAAVAICANDPDTYPQDSPENMAQAAAANGYTFPYLSDLSQQTAAQYRAACTPDFYLFDRGRELVYRGQFDRARPGNTELVTGDDLARAVELVLHNESVPIEQTPSVGCNIKWRSGNEPTYV